MPDKTIIQWQEKEARLADLKPYEKNPRKADKDAYARLKGKIERFGYHGRIICTQDMRVIGGHLRIRALKELGVDPVKVLVAPRPLTEDEYRELLITDNLEDGTWDNDILADAFDDEELLAWGMPDELLPDREPVAGLADPDDVPEPGGAPVSVPGDIWLLGNHRLMCGSSTDADAVAALLAGAAPMLMVTDPPYGVNYDADWRNHTGMARSARATGKVMNDDNADWSEAWALFPGDVGYIWHAGNMAHIVAESLIKCGLNIRAQIIWAKSNMVISRGDYHPKHEPCWYAVRKGKPGHYNGDRKQTTLWEIDKPMKSETGHSTQKPVECMRRPIENNSKPGDYVYEPFSGSGTTIIAAEQTGRKCYAMELSENYCDLAIRRFQNFTGKDAIHAETGETFNSRVSVPPARKARAKGMAPEQGA